MKKFFVIVISLTILVIAGYGISYVVSPVNSIPLEEYTHQIDYVCNNAFIVREESVYYADTNGIVYNIAIDTNRVSENSAISTTYNGDVSEETLKKLKTLDTKINKLKAEDANSNIFKPDEASVENEIASKMNQVISLARNNSIERIYEIREDINSLRTGDAVSAETKIQNLITERAIIEKSINVSKTDTLADHAGIFSSYIDNLESVLTPELIIKYSPEYIKSLNVQPNKSMDGCRVNTGDAICKVMNNHNWYILGITDNEHRLLFEAKPNVTIQFPNLSGASVTGECEYLSDADANGNSLFLLRVQTYLESAFSFRNVDAQVIFNEYNGYKIPTEAIHTRENINSYYVNARQGSKFLECDVEILYSDTNEGYSIIASTDDARNNLSSMDRLVVGER